MWQRLLVFQSEEQLHRAQRGGGKYNSAASEALRFSEDEGGRLLGGDSVPIPAIRLASEWLHVDHSSLGEHIHAAFLGEIQIVHVEGVFGAVTATHHAAAATLACGAFGTLTAEVRIGNGYS